MTREIVVVLHGMLRTHRHMRPLSRALEAAGYEVLNLSYPSRTRSMRELIERLYTTIAPKIADAPKVHFVGYSMGGLLVRAYMHLYRPVQAGRVVQLAPPNGGSEVADYLKDWPLYRWLYGPAGQQLITDQESIRDMFGPVDYPLGILAGTRCLDPFCAQLLKGAHDGKVTVERTKLAGMTSHKTIPATHTFFPTHRQVIMDTLQFLQSERFT